MIQIKRQEHWFVIMDDIRPIVEQLIPHTYKVYVDLTDGEIYITKGTAKNPKYKLISVVKANNESTRKKFVDKLTHSISQAIRNYTIKGCLVCKTTALKTYGKDFINIQDYYVETDNPYYKCSPSMILYNKDVLDYHYNGGMKVKSAA